MVIANPIYDVVFKRLMENDKVAKFFIGTLLEQTIENIEVKPPGIHLCGRTCGTCRFPGGLYCHH